MLLLLLLLPLACWLCLPYVAELQCMARRPAHTCPRCPPPQVKGPVRMPTRVLKITTRKSPCGNGCVQLGACCEGAGGIG